jgi:prophage regulatory protein
MSATSAARLFYCQRRLINEGAMSQKLLSYDDLRERGIGLSKVQLWRNESVGKFRKRVTLSRQRVAWLEAEIDAWLQMRITAGQPVVA